MSTTRRQYPQITTTMVAREVARLADKSPDHIYTKPPGTFTCRYTSGGARNHRGVTIVETSDGCIFGQALINLGVKRGDMAMCEGNPVNAVLGTLGITDDAKGRLITPFRRTQEEQDAGAKWGWAARHVTSALAVVS